MDSQNLCDLGKGQVFSSRKNVDFLIPDESLTKKCHFFYVKYQIHAVRHKKLPIFDSLKRLVFPIPFFGLPNPIPWGFPISRQAT